MPENNLYFKIKNNTDIKQPVKLFNTLDLYSNSNINFQATWDLSDLLASPGAYLYILFAPVDTGIYQYMVFTNPGLTLFTTMPQIAATLNTCLLYTSDAADE